MHLKTATIKTPFGKVGILTGDDYCARINFLQPNAIVNKNTNDYGKHVIDELEQYFVNCNHQFNVKLKIVGTNYQKKIWQGLTKIPLGKTFTYGEFAKKFNSGPRAIGQACRTNLFPIIIPCHRIVSKTSLGGFNGETLGNYLAIKKWLLQHETN